MWQIFESLYGWEFFFIWIFILFELFEWQFDQIENSWFKFLILSILKTLLHCFISSSVLIPFHVPYFFILEINSKFCDSLKFSIHVNFEKSPMLWNSMDPSNPFFKSLLNYEKFTLIFQVFLTAFFFLIPSFWISCILDPSTFVLASLSLKLIFISSISFSYTYSFLESFFSFISKLLICFPFVG